MTSQDLGSEDLSRIERQMQQACGDALDEEEKSEMAAVSEEVAMDVDEKRRVRVLRSDGGHF